MTQEARAAALQIEAERATAQAEKMLTVCEVAGLADLSERTVWRDIKRGILPVERWRVGKRYRVRIQPSEARRYVFHGEQPATSSVIR